MPRTEIKIKTWGCSDCDYLQDFEMTQENVDRHFSIDPTFVNKGVRVQAGECPGCALKGERAHSLLPMTRTEKQMTLTVIGEEDIDLEIEERTEATYRSRRLAEATRSVELMDSQGEFPTSVARDRYRAQREAEVEDDITSLKTMAGSAPGRPAFRPTGYFLTTANSVSNYRTRRRADITRAITHAQSLAPDS